MLCGMWSIKICLVKNFIFDYPLNQILEKKIKIFQFTKFSEVGEARVFLVLFIRFGSTQKQTQKFPQEIFFKLIYENDSNTTSWVNRGLFLSRLK